MTKTSLIIKDKHFRIYIPEEIKEAEGLRVGDIIEIDVTRVDKKKPSDVK